MIDSFSSATERHIEVGDSLEGYVIVNKGRMVDDLVGENVVGSLPQGLVVEEIEGEEEEGGVEVGFRLFLIKKPLKRD